MSVSPVNKLRLWILLLLWMLPVVFSVGLGMWALLQTGWMPLLAATLPVLWLAAWVIGHIWKPAKLQHASHRHPMTAPEFWTPQDTAAIAVVETFRSEVDDIDAEALANPNRYVNDAMNLADRLAQHYHHDSAESAWHPLTIVEVLSVVHLAVEDLIYWTLENVPGSSQATIGQIKAVPMWMNRLDMVMKVSYLASSIMNPAKLATYPLWRKSGRVTVELQNELIRKFYQRYLRQIGFYLIEMYSGRLRGGSQAYRQQFARMSAAVHKSRGDLSTLQSLADASTTIAVMGQVKAGKSSLVNSLLQDAAAQTSVLPQTRTVARYAYRLPDSKHELTLLDTPGYSEADVTRAQRAEIRQAAEAADLILLVLDAHSPARQSDLQAVKDLQEHYQAKRHLKPPPIIAVLTHIDLLRPVREWSPPYDWRTPTQLKEESIAAAAAYAREVFGDSICDVACVYVGQEHPVGTNVADELVPLLLAHLGDGQSAAVLKAFYKRLSEQRFQQLRQQAVGLVKQVFS
jgi:uncharacterized protein